MNSAAVSAEDIPLPVWSGALSAYAVAVMDSLSVDNWDLSVLLCGDKTIKALNAAYRNKNESTDVLSFELGVEEPGADGIRYLPGDVVISLDTLRENARYFKIDEDEELRRLLIHGILHLKGFDHKTNDTTEPMLETQEQLLNKMPDERILPEGTSASGGSR